MRSLGKAPPSGLWRDGSSTPQLRRLRHRRPVRRRRRRPCSRSATARCAGEGGARQAAHDGAVLAAVRHPTGEGVITGGDDGRLVWSRRGRDAGAGRGQGPLDRERRGRGAASGLVAFGAGREARVLDVADAGFRAGLRPRALGGRRGARRRAAGAWRSATYGGAALWYARIAEQQPVMLRWAGSPHRRAVQPRRPLPDVVDAGERAARLAASPTPRTCAWAAIRPRCAAWLSSKAACMLATAGAPGVVVWPFAGADGPMGKQAMEIGFDETLAGHPRRRRAGRDACWRRASSDGRVWACDVASGRRAEIRRPSPARRSPRWRWPAAASPGATRKAAPACWTCRRCEGMRSG